MDIDNLINQLVSEENHWDASILRVASTCDQKDSRFYDWKGNGDIKRRANEIISEMSMR